MTGKAEYKVSSSFLRGSKQKIDAAYNFEIVKFKLENSMEQVDELKKLNDVFDLTLDSDRDDKGHNRGVTVAALKYLIKIQEGNHSSSSRSTLITELLRLNPEQNKET